MEIKASCKFDYASAKALAHLSFYGKWNPKHRFIFWTVVYGIMLLMIGLEWLWLRNPMLLAFMGICIGFILLQFYTYFLLPKIRYKAMGKTQGIENVYVFMDDGIKASARGAGIETSGEMAYTTFIRVLETSRYFFIFQSKNQAFLVDKSTIEGGTAEQIRSRLSAVEGMKYTICNY